MSVAAISWASQQTAGSPGAKLVLIALANYANEANECWPSQATLARWTEQTDRTIRGHLQVLEAKNLIHRQSREVAGRFMSDFITLAIDKVPDVAPGRRKNLPTEKSSYGKKQQVPAEKSSANPYIYPSLIKDSRARESAGIQEDVWRDFLELRRAKRAPLTATALAGIDREARKAGISLADALLLCCERNWQGFRANWDRESSRPAAQQRDRKLDLLLGRRLPDLVTVVDATVVDADHEERLRAIG